MIPIEKNQVLSRKIKMKQVNQSNEQYVSVDCDNCKYRDSDCPIAKMHRDIFPIINLACLGVVQELISPEECSMFQLNTSDLRDKKIKKQKTKTPLFSEAMDIYSTWHLNKFGIKPRIMVADTTALKAILIHMESLIKHMESLSSSANVYSSSTLFKIMLDNWDKLDPFIQKGTDLRMINSNLNSILKNLKNGKQSNQPKYISAADKNKSELRDMVEESKRNLSGS